MMKSLPIVTLMAIALLLSTAAARECLTGDMTRIGQLAQDPAVVRGCTAFATTTDFLQADYCSDLNCVAAMKTLIPKLPKCEVSGISLAQAMQIGLDACGPSPALSPVSGGTPLTSAPVPAPAPGLFPQIRNGATTLMTGVSDPASAPAAVATFAAWYALM